MALPQAPAWHPSPEPTRLDGAWTIRQTTETIRQGLTAASRTTRVVPLPKSAFASASSYWITPEPGKNGQQFIGLEDDAPAVSAIGR
jgi:hypothetical protein